MRTVEKRKAAFAIALAIAATFATTDAVAAERVKLVYHGPPASRAPTVTTCPRDDEAFVALHANLPDVATSDGVFEVDVEVSEKRGGGYRGQLTVNDRSARTLTRELTSPSCPDLLKAMSFVLGVAYRETNPEPPAKATDTPANEAPAPSAAVTASPSAAEKPVPSAPASSRASHVELGLDVRGAALVGATPNVAPRVEGLVEIGLARDSMLSPAVRVGAAYATGGMNVDSGRASFSVLAGVLAACPLRFGKGDDAKVQLVPCARFEIGDIHGQGEGLPAARDQRSLWTAGGLEVTARWKVHSALTLELTSALLLPLRRHTYVIDPQRVIHQTGTLVFQAGGGVLFSAL